MSISQQSLIRRAETQSTAGAIASFVFICAVVWFTLPGWEVLAEDTQTIPAGAYYFVGVTSPGAEFRVTATEADNIPMWVFYLNSQDHNSGGFGEFLSQRAISSIDHNMLKKNGQIKKPKKKFLDAGTWYFCFYNPDNDETEEDIVVSYKIEAHQ